MKVVKLLVYTASENCNLKQVDHNHNFPPPQKKWKIHHLSVVNDIFSANIFKYFWKTIYQKWEEVENIF